VIVVWPLLGLRLAVLDLEFLVLIFIIPANLSTEAAFSKLNDENISSFSGFSAFQLLQIRLFLFGQNKKRESDDPRLRESF